MQDHLGNPVSAMDAAALAGVDDFISGFLAYETQAVNVLAAADKHPEATLANIYSGMIWMFLEAPEAAAQAGKYIAVAQATAGSANRREKALLALLEAWAANDMPRAEALGLDIIREWPTDLATMKLAQYMAFNRGDAERMLTLAKTVEHANRDNAHWHGMAAFGHEQCHDLAAAEAAAWKALELKEKEPWAQHALAHVMITQGRNREGIAFMDGVTHTWQNLNSFMYTHNWWHKALFNISLGNFAAVYDAYDHHVWGMEKGYSQDQVGAVSLLARMECAGLDVGDRWQDVADWMRPRAQDTTQPFLTLQYLYGLARAGRGESDTLLRAVEDKAASAAGFERVAWTEVALPAARGVLAQAKGDHAGAAKNLRVALPRMQEIGGSHAQRDLFEQLYLDALLKSGDLAAARDLMELRRTFDPDGVPLNRLLAETCDRLGLAGEAAKARARIGG
jgi:predicted Zn-dependent protease